MAKAQRRDEILKSELPPTLPLMALRRVMPAWLLAVLVAGGSAAGAAAPGRAGFSRLAAVAPEALEQRAKEAVENVAEVVK